LDPNTAGGKVKQYLAKRPPSMKIQVHVPTPLNSQKRKSLSQQQLSSFAGSEPAFFARTSQDQASIPRSVSMSEYLLEALKAEEEETQRQAAVKERMEEEIKRLIQSRINPENTVSPDIAGGGIMARKRRMRHQYHEAILQRQLVLQKKLMVELLQGVKLKRSTVKAFQKPARKRTLMKEGRQNLMKQIRNFNKKLRHVITQTTREGPREVLMRSIRERGDAGLRQVVGRSYADMIIPTISHIIWKGKRCFGVTYRDIHGLLLNPCATRDIVTRLAERHRASNVNVVIGVLNEAAVFFASRLAVKLGARYASLQTGNRARAYINHNTSPIESLLARPGRQSEMCAAMGAIREADRVLIIDDVLEGGGALAAAESLVCALGAEVVECVCIIEMVGFGGRERMSGSPVYTMLKFDDNREVFKV